MRATHFRASRNDSRAPRGTSSVTRKKNGQHREGHESEPPVEGQHHPHDPEEREEVAEDRDDARREELVHGVHVGRDPRDQPPDGVLVEVGDVQALEVAEDLRAHVQHDLLARHLEDEHLAEAHDERGEQRQQHRAAATPTRPAASPFVMWRSIATLVR